MHYFDISLKKTALITALIAALLVCVAFTFSWKQSTFGSTPFFHSAGLLWARTIASITYSIERGTLLAALGFPVTLTAHMGGDTTADAIPVLVYHRIVNPGNEVNRGNIEESDGYNISIAAFKDHMETLSRAGWDTVTLEEYQKFMRGEITLPEKSFLLTFDDGTKDSFYPVDPILNGLGFTAVNYLIVKDTHIEGSVYYLSPSEIHSMLATRRWEIGSHSNNAHVSYPRDAAGNMGYFYSDLLWIGNQNRLETPAEFGVRVEEDLVYSQTALEETYNVSITSMAFPFGNYGQDTQNFPEAAAITLQKAANVYDTIFSQTRSGMFTFNYPGKNNFHSVRIEPMPDWTGADVLASFTRGFPKDLPYSDTFRNNNGGWLGSWGVVEVGDGSLRLRAEETKTGATVLLDGTYTWNNYEIEASVTWQRGHLVLLSDVREERTNRACTFSNGSVRLQNRDHGTASLIKEVKDERIVPGDHTVGMISNGATLSCVWNGEVILTVEDVADQFGGVGFEVWSPDAGAAAAVVHSVSISHPSNVETNASSEE